MISIYKYADKIIRTPTGGIAGSANCCCEQLIDCQCTEIFGYLMRRIEYSGPYAGSFQDVDPNVPGVYCWEEPPNITNCQSRLTIGCGPIDFGILYPPDIDRPIYGYVIVDLFGICISQGDDPVICGNYLMGGYLYTDQVVPKQKEGDCACSVAGLTIPVGGITNNSAGQNGSVTFAEVFSANPCAKND